MKDKEKQQEKTIRKFEFLKYTCYFIANISWRNEEDKTI
jgi:hypothetical protein